MVKHLVDCQRALKYFNLLQEMSSSEFEKLRALVLQNPDLQAELQKINDRDLFVARVVRIGCELGLDLASEDILETMRENRQAWIERWI